MVLVPNWAEKSNSRYPCLLDGLTTVMRPTEIPPNSLENCICGFTLRVRAILTPSRIFLDGEGNGQLCTAMQFGVSA